MAAADLNNDGTIEVVVMDTSSNVLCFEPDGQLLWETQITGSVIAGMRIADINLDGQLDVIIATDSG